MITDKALDAAHLDSQPAPTLPAPIAADVAAVYASLQQAIKSTLVDDRHNTRMICRDAVDGLQKLERTINRERIADAAAARLLSELRDAMDAEDQP